MQSFYGMTNKCQKVKIKAFFYRKHYQMNELSFYRQYSIFMPSKHRHAQFKCLFTFNIYLSYFPQNAFLLGKNFSKRQSELHGKQIIKLLRHQRSSDCYKKCFLCNLEFIAVLCHSLVQALIEINCLSVVLLSQNKDQCSKRSLSQIEYRGDEPNFLRIDF